MTQRMVIETRVKHVDLEDTGFTVAKGHLCYQDDTSLERTKPKKIATKNSFRYQDITQIGIFEKKQKIPTGLPFVHSTTHEAELYVWSGEAWTVLIKGGYDKKLKGVHRVLAERSVDRRWEGFLADAGDDFFCTGGKRFYADGRVIDKETGELAGKISSDSPVVFLGVEAAPAYTIGMSGPQKVRIGSTEIDLFPNPDLILHALDHFCGIKIQGPG